MTVRVSADSRERRFGVVVSKTGRLIDKFLRYRDRGLLTDLSYPAPLRSPRRATAGRNGGGNGKGGVAVATQERPAPPGHALPTRAPHIEIGPPPREDFQGRSWYDPAGGCICVNREHTEFLLAQREDSRCVRFLFTIWVKESLLQEYGEDAERLADEMVGMLAEAEPLLW